MFRLDPATVRHGMIVRGLTLSRLAELADVNLSTRERGRQGPTDHSYQRDSHSPSIERHADGAGAGSICNGPTRAHFYREPALTLICPDPRNLSCGVWDPDCPIGLPVPGECRHPCPHS